MPKLHSSIVWIVHVLPIVLVGCGGGGAPRAKPQAAKGPPIGLQIVEKDPALRGKRFNGVLHFETSSDAVFVATHPSPRVTKQQAHTGRAALQLGPGTRRVSLKLATAAGGDFFGQWPLVWPYVYSNDPIELNVSYDLRSGRRLIHRRVSVPQSQWTSASVDVSALRPGPGTADATLVLDFDQPLAAPVWIDDVLLVDNAQTLLDTGKNGWTVRRRGHRITIDRPLSFNLGLTTAEGAPDGWTIEEINPLRARFASAGATKAITVYYDGRSMWDGQYKGLSARTRDDKTLAAAHATPAEVSVPPELGKVDRNTPGDADNDGYNESTGAYRVAATGPRIEVTLSPRSVPVTRPVLQISGLPDGKVLITLDGQLIEHSLRLENGDVLVELPSRIVRTSTLSASIRGE